MAKKEKRKAKQIRELTELCERLSAELARRPLGHITPGIQAWEYTRYEPGKAL
jgi:hypothetical protein